MDFQVDLHLFTFFTNFSIFSIIATGTLVSFWSMQIAHLCPGNMPSSERVIVVYRVSWFAQVCVIAQNTYTVLLVSPGTFGKMAILIILCSTQSCC